MGQTYDGMIPAQLADSPVDAPPGRPTEAKLAMHRDRSRLMREALEEGGALVAGTSAVYMLLELSDGLQSMLSELAAGC